MDPTRSLDELIRLIRERMSSLSASQRRVAEAVLSNSEIIAFSSVAEVAKMAGVNGATVVRFANTLGFDGFLAMREVFRRNLQRQVRIQERFESLEELDQSEFHPLEVTANLDREAIKRMVTQMDRTEWDAVVARLAAAEHLFVLGMRQSYVPAFSLAYLLSLVRPHVTEIGTPAGLSVERLRWVTDRDVAVVISVRPYSRDVVLAARWLAKQGTTVVALTDNPASPIAAVATHSFYANTAAVSVLHSTTALNSMVQALSAAVALADGGATRYAVRREQELLDMFNVHHPQF